MTGPPGVPDGATDRGTDGPTDEPLSVLFVIDTLGAGGTEHSTALLAADLARRGHRVSVATFRDAGFGDEERHRADGLDVRPMAASTTIGRLRELRRRIADDRPDLVHTALFSADMVGRTAAWGTGVPVVSSLVGTRYDAPPMPARWHRQKLAGVRVADGVTARLMVQRLHAVSDGVAQSNAAALRFPLERVTVVPRGRSRAQLGEWSADRRTRVRSSLGLDAEPLILSVGRHEFVKGHRDLVAAFDRVAACRPDARLLIAGRNGHATADLQQALVEHPRAAASTQLLGHRHDVADLLCAADVLAISSHAEGTAGVALEAMALRCPVVCTAVTGISGVLTDGVDAVLVPVADPAAMSAALATVVADQALADELRRAGLDAFERRFRSEVVVHAMEGLYRQVILEARR